MNIALYWSNPHKGAGLPEHDILKNLQDRIYRGAALITQGALDALKTRFALLSESQPGDTAYHPNNGNQGG